MNIADRLRLIKAGYTAKEIKEMEIAEASEDKTAGSAEAEPVTEEAESTPEHIEAPEEKTPEVDYRKLWEDSQKNLELARKALNSKDLTKEEDKQDVLELVADFFRN